MQSNAGEVRKTLEFLADASSPIRSQKGREKVQPDSDFDDQYDEYFNSLPLFNAKSQDCVKELTRSFSFTQRIISCNLKHHQPDDFDIESLTVRVKQPLRASKSRDLSDEMSIRNLPFLLTSLNLSSTTLF
jgi:hypothetical protein